MNQARGIKPLYLQNMEYRALAYADDIVVVTTDTATALPIIKDLANQFGLFSGYKLNLEKTQILYSGKDPWQT